MDEMEWDKFPICSLTLLSWSCISPTLSTILSLFKNVKTISPSYISWWVLLCACASGLLRTPVRRRHKVQETHTLFSLPPSAQNTRHSVHHDRASLCLSAGSKSVSIKKKKNHCSFGLLTARAEVELTKLAGTIWWCKPREGPVKFCAFRWREM